MRVKGIAQQSTSLTPVGRRRVAPEPTPQAETLPPIEQERLLSDDEMLAMFWQDYRYKIGKRRLQKLRRDQTGPPYHRIGFQVVYPEARARAWIRTRMGKLVRGTAEEAANRQLSDAAAD
jgi:hypothetical protein